MMRDLVFQSPQARRPLAHVSCAGGAVSVAFAALLCPAAWAATELGADPAQAEQAPLAVEVLDVQISPSIQALSLTGEIAARDTLRVAFPEGGRIADVLVSEGDHVRQGDALARIEKVQQEQNLRAAEAGMTTAKADLLQANNDARRQEELLARGATTRTARDEAGDALRAAEASFARAEAELELAQKDLADTVLRAPADAIITARDAEVGQVVGAAETVMELALGADYDAVFNVPEALLTVPRNQPPVVGLELIDIAAPPFRGEVREVSPLIDPELGTVQVKMGVVDPPTGIAFGASVRGRVQREDPPVATLAFTALIASAEGPAVWVVDPASSQVSLRQVEILRHETGQVLISGGLRDGEQVVGRGSQLLFPGRQVRAVPVIDAAASGGER
jgi:RND family efflux transporter MFP subunit